MAGSWGHITDDQGRFQGTRLIDNLGDACEALEECYGMVQLLANSLADAALVGSLHTREDWIRWAEEHYQAALNIGGRHSGRPDRAPDVPRTAHARSWWHRMREGKP